MRCRHDGRVTGILYVYIDLVARPWLFSRLFFCRIPTVSRKVRVGLLTEVGLAPQARPREQPGRLRRVAQVSLRRLAPDLQACLLFSPTGLKRTVEDLRAVFLALYMFSASFIFQDLRISSAGGFLVRRDPPFRACCACSPSGRTKGSRRWLGLQE